MVPVIDGYIHMEKLTLNGYSFGFYLISRRFLPPFLSLFHSLPFSPLLIYSLLYSFIRLFNLLLNIYRGCQRSGARFHTRGADPLGNVANFVETEQILSFRGAVSSFVQTRFFFFFFFFSFSSSLFFPKRFSFHFFLGAPFHYCGCKEQKVQKI